MKINSTLIYFIELWVKKHYFEVYSKFSNPRFCFFLFTLLVYEWSVSCWKICLLTCSPVKTYVWSIKILDSFLMWTSKLCLVFCKFWKSRTSYGESSLSWLLVGLFMTVFIENETLAGEHLSFSVPSTVNSLLNSKNCLNSEHSLCYLKRWKQKLVRKTPVWKTMHFFKLKI